MKRLSALLAATAIALLTTGTAAWGTDDGCVGSDSYCHPSPTGSPSSTPTPSVSPSSTPTPTPSSTPSPTPTPSATWTPSATPTPTPSVTPSATPTPTTSPEPTPSASVVQPPAPTLVDATCDEVTTIAVPPDTKDYTYTWPHPEGDRWMGPGETETITVTPAPGVTLTPPTSWTFTGQAAPDCTTPVELPQTGVNPYLAVAGIALLGAGFFLYLANREW